MKHPIAHVKDNKHHYPPMDHHPIPYHNYDNGHPEPGYTDRGIIGAPIYASNKIIDEG